MKMHLVITFCLLGVLSAQEVTKLTSCQTKDKNLRMDCEYTLPDQAKKPTCEYRQDDQVMGSTDSTVKPEPTFKNRANVTLLEGNVCRLVLTGFSQEKAKNNTCIIKEAGTANRTQLVDPKTVLTCSAISMLFQSISKVLLAMTLLPVLL